MIVERGVVEVISSRITRSTRTSKNGINNHRKKSGWADGGALVRPVRVKNHRHTIAGTLDIRDLEYDLELIVCGPSASLMSVP